MTSRSTPARTRLCDSSAAAALRVAHAAFMAAAQCMRSEAVLTDDVAEKLHNIEKNLDDLQRALRRMERV